MLRVSAVIVLLNLLNISFAQSNVEQSLNSLSNAAGASFNMYDIPAGTLVLSSAFFPLRLSDKLNVNSFSFDKTFQQSFYVPGSNSLGSMDPRMYPQTVFLGRIAYTAAAGMIFGMDTYDEYKHSFIFFKTVMYNFAITELVKNLTHRDRPDGSNDKSFFSGHTSSTFATSTFLFMELNSLINDSVNDDVLRTTLKTTSFAALYGWAGYVGYSRMRDNKHFFSDVLIGAAVGTAVGLYFFNHYFDNDPGFLDNFNVGVSNNQPVLNFSLHF